MKYRGNSLPTKWRKVFNHDKTGRYLDEKRTGSYRCIVCATKLFDSETKEPVDRFIKSIVSSMKTHELLQLVDFEWFDQSGKV